jgi:hypothetical protein
MRFAIQVTFWAVGIPLQVLTITALLRGWYRRFPFVFAYVVACLLAAFIEVPLNVARYLKMDVAPRGPAYYYWINEVLTQVLIFAVVVSLISYATAALQSRRVLRTCLIGGPLLLAAISFGVHYKTEVVTGAWMAPWLRDLNFGAAILDLLLWGMLIAAKQKDYKVLMLSGALGIQFTGEAIGSALRTLSAPTKSKALSLTGAIIVVLADLVCLYIWWQTFRARPAQEKGRCASAAQLPLKHEG